MLIYAEEGLLTLNYFGFLGLNKLVLTIADANCSVTH